MKYSAVQRLIFASLFLIVTAISGIAVAAFTITNDSSSSSAQGSEFVVVELHKEYLSPDSVALKIGQEIQIVNRSSEARELFLGAGDAHGNNNDEHSHEHQTGFSTSLIGTDEAWQGSFAEAGTYFLHDHENADINLLVVVYE